ncbi:heptosyltransferase-1 [Paraburkholderia bannensis]|uniref:Lipopolysaccharide heptosyltransferase 1 n=1 Tax=Paraburkholderia bannensis TaxID=765414 RepID=A0A7W9WQP6_9BURK|nr:MULTISPECIES: lipopolysaccharide heptosyltransferase I [Paraburkholderia]MBB3255523.1 heptosyltransferase-1 [Paraburkholderia sp. WP4_3_2]MBB6100466.1 heptosyltransferase-1 [Paraburkholderia bannensis]
MKRVLIVKVTSLGDVVEALPVVADVQRKFPGVKVDWAVDEAFAGIVHWNAGIDRVLCAPLRRFKKARKWSDFKAIWDSIAELRRERYDAIIDIHGVYKSAIIAFIARGKRRFGYLGQDLGERGAAFAYNGRFGPRPKCDAWLGMRISTGEALGYTIDTPPDFQMRIPRDGDALPKPDAPTALIFHATSKEEKKWPVAHWGELCNELVKRGLRIELPWGSDAEHATAKEIAALVPGATILPRLTVTQVAQRIEDSALVVGTDTGFVHLGHALLKPTVMIFVATNAEHLGVRAPDRSISIGDGRHVPPVSVALDAVDRVYPARTGDAAKGPAVTAA